MSRRPAAATPLALAFLAVAVLMLSAVSGAVVDAPVAAASQMRPAMKAGPPTAKVAGPSLPPKAWILVDASSGVVLDAGNDRTPMPPASLTKLLTAVVASQALQPTDSVAVSERAAAEPARKINMKAGEVWLYRDALYALLLSSANDAAAAIGERVGGSLENFASIMSAAGQQMGLADSPVVQDPAGLDDENSVAGGNMLSARDLAIIVRAALSQPVVAATVATPIYRFVGPDGSQHRLRNHIYGFLTSYPGAIGLKPGFTQRAGSGRAFAARRNGRTLISIVLDAPSSDASAIAMLDRGFGLPADAAGTGDVLPPVRLPDAPTGPKVAGAVSPIPASQAVHHRSSTATWTSLVVILFLVPLALAIMTRRRAVKRRRAQRLAGHRARG